MTIPFVNTPPSTRVPLTFFEIDPSRANSATVVQRALIIGQIRTGFGSATPNVPELCLSLKRAKNHGGQGSLLALMYEWYRKRDPSGEVWLLPIADNGGGTAAIGSVQFTAAATAAGTLSLYIAGMLVSMNVVSTQTTAQLATALVAAINALTDLPVTAAVDGGDTTLVNITAKHKGAAGNDIDIRLSYRGTTLNEQLPTGMAVTIVAMSGGATNPDLTTALANCVDQPFDFIVSACNDSTSLNAIQSFLNDVSGRWAPNRKIFGHHFYGFNGTLGARITFGDARNNQHETVAGLKNCPTPPWLFAANVAGAAAVSLRLDPAQPLQTLMLDVLAPALQSRDGWIDRDTLLRNGFSSYTVDSADRVHIERLITTYQVDTGGQPDNSYLDSETMFTLMAAMRAIDTMLNRTFSRKKIAADGTVVLPNSNTVTPAVIKAAIVGLYKQMERDGLVQQTEVFAAGLIVEIDSTNPNRVNILWDGVLQPGLRILATLIQFAFQ